MTRIQWQPHQPHTAVTRVIETSCCGALEWCSEGGRFLVLRRCGDHGHEETGRGRYPDARRVWNALLAAHACTTPS
ncbi:hypothetical protein GCM10009850_012200 [Nonomuraea monospora]|uniref:Uncharacterized protein n=1 Tax=Nonomuraea monospora TaxID=568818 RepID=A0ABN3C906_9ACTN